MSEFSRAAALLRMASERVDLLVVGAGITGSGIAREAALRGLKVALVDARDFASGTSSRSTRLIHGGLRYLRQGQLGLVREAVRERQALLAMAPHLVRPMKFLFPVYRGDPDALWAVRLGVSVYERLGGLPLRSERRSVSASRIREEMPQLSDQELVGGAAYEDAVTDDARLTLAVARAAAAAGAEVANYCRVVRFLAREDGKVQGAEVRDEESGAVFAVQAKRVLVAAGPYADDLRTGGPPLLRLTKGAHLAVRRERLPLSSACVLRGPDRRLMFAVPYGAVTYLGTTDTFVDSPDDDSVTPADAAYILAAAARAFPAVHLDAGDVLGAWAGVRPLVQSPAAALPSNLSREYRLYFAPDGLVHVVGGKLTAFRAMAAQVLDRLFTQTSSAESARRSRSPLPGAEGSMPGPEDWRRLARTVSVPAPLLHAELSPYGSEAASVLMDLPAEREQSPLNRLARMRLRYAVREEMALHLTDVLRRRTNLVPFGGPEARREIAPLGREMALLRGWSPERQAAEVATGLALWDAMLAWRDGAGAAAPLDEG